MSNRNEVDQVNEKRIYEVIKYYPDCVESYNIYLKNDKTSNTRYCYIKYVCDFLDFIEEQYNIDIYEVEEYLNIKPLMIDNYMDYISYKSINGEKIKCGDSIKNAKLAAVNKFFIFLKENKYIKENPCLDKKFKKHKTTKEITYMTAKEIKKVEKAIISRTNNKKFINRDLAIFMLGCGTGLRVSAIVGINVRDIDFNKLVINNIVEKGEVTKSVYIPQKVAEVIKVWMDEREILLKDDIEKTDALFINPSHNRISVGGVRDMTKQYSKIINKNITPHKMRSTYGMNLYDKTGDIYLVQEMLGHANISNTMIYARASETKKRIAVDAINKLI
jgi:integrase/recombinase XerC